MKDSEGNPLKSAHILGFFRRICKLLFFNIKPVFVFDGGVPALKRATIIKRRERRIQVRDSIQRTAEKILQKQLQLHAVGQLQASSAKSTSNPSPSGPSEYVYHDDIYATSKSNTPHNNSYNTKRMSSANRRMAAPATSASNVPASNNYATPLPTSRKRKTGPTDEFDLPPMDETKFKAGGRDRRLATVADLKDFIESNRSLIESLDMDSHAFNALPLEVQYEILQESRVRSRSTNYERLDHMMKRSKNSLDFSKSQIEGLIRRNDLTQRVSEMITGKPVTVKNRSGGKGEGAAFVPRRIAAERGREFVMVKNDEKAGGWTLKVEEKESKGVVVATGNRIVGEGVSVPVRGTGLRLAQELQRRVTFGWSAVDEDSEVIDVDESDFKTIQEGRDLKVDMDDEEEEFEDVDMNWDSLNRAEEFEDVDMHSADHLIEDIDEQGSGGRLDQETLDMIAAIDQITAVEDQGPAPNSEVTEISGFNQELSGLQGDDDTDEGGGRATQRRALKVRKPLLLLSESDDSGDEELLEGFSTTKGHITALLTKKVSQETETFGVPAKSLSGTTKVKMSSKPLLVMSDSDEDDRVPNANSHSPSPPPSLRNPPSLTQPASDFWASSGPSSQLASPTEFLNTWSTVASDVVRRIFPSTFPSPNNLSLEESMRRVLNMPNLDDIADELRTVKRKLDKMGDSDALRQKAECIAFWAGFLEAAHHWKTQISTREEEGIDSRDLDGEVGWNPVGSQSPETLSSDIPLSASGGSRRPRERLLEVEDSDSDGGMVNMDPSQIVAKSSNRSNPQLSNIGLARVEDFVNLNIPSLNLPQNSHKEFKSTHSEHESITSSPAVVSRRVLNTSLPPRMLLSSIVSPRLHSRGTLPEILEPPQAGVSASNRGSTAEFDPSPGKDSNHVHTVLLESVDLEGINGPGDLLVSATHAFAGDEDAERIDVSTTLNEEEDEYAKFISNVSNKDLSTVRADLESEIQHLNFERGKDERHGQEVTDQMVADSQELLRLFGVPYIVATMEAEAQCAELLRLGLVEGIITDDSDVFLFGGDRVYRHVFSRDKFVECYLAADLDNDMSLSRAKLIQLAYLLGSDYTEGLQGVGAVTALEIINEFGEPNSTDGLDALIQFKEFCSRLASGKELPEDRIPQRKRLRKLCQRLTVPDDFPDAHVRCTYINPAVDSSQVRLSFAAPDVDRLRSFLGTRLGWRQEKVDEVILPIIRNMRQKDAEGIQARIDQFLPIASDSGASTKFQRLKSKRAQAVFSSWKKKSANNDEESDTDSLSEESRKVSITTPRNQRARQGRKIRRKS
ncbi:DNA repair protein rad2 [Gonapodya sp. JEL0774]|nr:DNA repair protein rad2 [Gonapodya sp. JEL0774]